jgi:CheY-like chemotaxis protein
MMAKAKEESGYSVLIIEDSKEAGKYLKTALETMDEPFEVTVLPSAEEALLTLVDTKFNLMIVDVQLPGIDGVRMVKRIRNQDRKTKIIMQTGIKSEEVLAAIDTVQIDGFIQKPFKVGQIVDSVRKALNLKAPEPKLPVEAFPDIEEAKFENPEVVAATLTDMINRLGAREACVLDSHGKIGFQALLTDKSGLNEAMLESIVKARAAAKELQKYVETDSPRNVFVLRGKSTDILFATIYQYTLVLVLNTGATALKVSLAFEELIRIQDAFTRELYRQPDDVFDTIPNKPSTPSTGSLLEDVKSPAKKEKKSSEQGKEMPDSIPQISDEAFQKILNTSIQQVQIPEENVDSFWETAADSRFNDLSGRNLSFEEAKEQGLNSIE